jgi:hypothetical protein
MLRLGDAMEEIRKVLPSMKTTRFLAFLLLTAVSGCCSVLSNSASYYRDHPPQRIHLREITSD